nr:odorant-binding protein 11 [Gregopimpla kuwanae]
MKCLLTTAQIMDEEGKIDVDLFVSAIPEEYLSIAEPMLRECGNIRGVDNCDTAFLTNKCWYSMQPKFYWLP